LTTTATRAAGRATFQAQSPFRTELCRRVDAYFTERGLDQRGGAGWVLKSLVIVGWAVASYLALMFVAGTWWSAALLAVSLGLALAAIGFCIMHDAGHGAASRGGWVNRLGFASVDMIGGSSFFWHHKHNVLHHTYTNVEGLDEDIDATPFLRLAPNQRRYWFHRFQHWYMLPLLAFFVPKWTLFDDWRTWFDGQIASTPIPRPRGWDAVQLVAGKVVFAAWAIVLPLVFHPALHVLGAFALGASTVSITLAIVFQLAHAVEGPAFATIPAEGERLERPFFEHQIATTSDFAPGNRLLTWFVGGLNYQVVHHLFPKTAHRHYPALAKITEEVCREFGIRYNRHRTILEAIRSHVRFVVRMGKAAPATI
jgi:linoleoyl-CoA desaturase